MDLREFIEEDIVSFLESVNVETGSHSSSSQGASANGPVSSSASSASGHQGTKSVVRSDESAATYLKDYEAELFAALKEDNIPHAKRILHEVRDALSSYPMGSPERHRLQVLLHSLYEKFKEYIDDMETFSKMERALDEAASEAGLSSPKEVSEDRDVVEKNLSINVNAEATRFPTKELSDDVNVTSAKTAKAMSSKPSDVSIPQSPEFKNGGETKSEHKTRVSPDESIGQFIAHLSALNAALEREDVVKAHHHYKKVKSLFSSLLPDHKKKHHSAVIGHHNAIVALMKKRSSNSAQTSASNNSVVASAKSSSNNSSDVVSSGVVSSDPSNYSPHDSSTTPPSSSLNSSAEDISRKQLVALESQLRSSLKAHKVVEASHYYEQLRDLVPESALSAAEVHDLIYRLHQYHDIIVAHLNASKKTVANKAKSGARTEPNASSPNLHSLDAHEKQLRGLP